MTLGHRKKRHGEAKPADGGCEPPPVVSKRMVRDVKRFVLLFLGVNSGRPAHRDEAPENPLAPALASV